MIFSFQLYILSKDIKWEQRKMRDMSCRIFLEDNKRKKRVVGYLVLIRIYT